MKLIYMFIKYFNIDHSNKKAINIFKLQSVSEIGIGSDKFE